VEVFFDRINIGQEIPPLTKKAAPKQLFDTWGRTEGVLHPGFAGTDLEQKLKEGSTKADDSGASSIHSRMVVAGNQIMEYISQMVTGWLLDPQAWISGGKLSMNFIKTTPPNEVITCKGKVIRKVIENNQKYLICEVWVENEQADKVAVGEIAVRF